MLASAPVISTMPAVDISRKETSYTQKLGLKPINVPDSESPLLFEAGNNNQIFCMSAKERKRNTLLPIFLSKISKPLSMD